MIPLRTWTEIFKKEGVIAVIAFFLLWFVTGQLNAGVNSNTQAIENMRKLLQDHTSDYRQDTLTIKYLLRIQCIHASHDDRERQECNAANLDGK